MDQAALDRYLFERPIRQAELARRNSADPTRANVVTADLTLLARDGSALAATRFYPATARGARRGTVIVASATGVKRGFYAHFARHLASLGLEVLTFDYRGIGGSTAAASDYPPRLRDWGELDLAGAVEWALAHGVGPLSIVGHSVGGQLAGLLPNLERVAALVLVAAQSGDYRLWPLPGRLAMAAFWYLTIPAASAVFGKLPAAIGVGHDLPRGVALEWARWGRTAGYMIGDDPRLARRFAAFRGNLLAFGVERDGYAPRPAVEWLVERYSGSAEREVRWLAASFGHFGFFRRSRHAQIEWGVVADALLASGTAV
ncbi:MAG: alpha/beta fold hydrolase [Polyangiaceae bacterium]